MAFTLTSGMSSWMISGMFKEKDPELCVPGKVNLLKGNIQNDPCPLHASTARMFATTAVERSSMANVTALR